MHSKFKNADQLTSEVIGAALEVHTLKGAGLLESIYEKCLLRELQIRNISCKNQVLVPVEYKGYVFEETLRLDVIVDDCLIVELKSVKEVLPIHKAQLMSYMKLLDIPIGLILNFNVTSLKKGIYRMMLPNANKE
jgi:GxxExxY protein